MHCCFLTLVLNGLLNAWHNSWNKVSVFMSVSRLMVVYWHVRNIRAAGAFNQTIQPLISSHRAAFPCEIRPWGYSPNYSSSTRDSVGRCWWGHSFQRPKHNPVIISICESIMCEYREKFKQHSWTLRIRIESIARILFTLADALHQTSMYH